MGVKDGLRGTTSRNWEQTMISYPELGWPELRPSGGIQHRRHHHRPYLMHRRDSQRQFSQLIGLKTHWIAATLTCTAWRWTGFPSLKFGLSMLELKTPKRSCLIILQMRRHESLEQTSPYTFRLPVPASGTGTNIKSINLINGLPSVRGLKSKETKHWQAATIALQLLGSKQHIPMKPLLQSYTNQQCRMVTAIAAIQTMAYHGTLWHTKAGG